MGDENGGGPSQTEFDLATHNVKLTVVPPGEDGKARTQLAFIDKTSTVTLMVDVKASGEEAVKAAAKAMAPLLGPAFDMLLAELEKDGSETAWHEVAAALFERCLP